MTATAVVLVQVTRAPRSTRVSPASEAAPSGGASAVAAANGQEAGAPDTSGPGPTPATSVLAENAVLNESASTDLSGWRAESDSGPVQLRRVTGISGPAGGTTAVDVSRRGGNGTWAWALISLRTPEEYFQIGRTYRMQLWVRDADAASGKVGMLLGDGHYQQRPTEVSQYGGFADRSWHLLSRTFVCTAPGGSGTSLYVDLPATGSFHFQLAAASVRRVAAPGPARVNGPPTRVVSFAGPAGRSPNPAEWNHEIGGNGWGNNELQTYTASAANAQVDGAGHLRITAYREDATGPDGIPRHYTSARLSTEGKVAVQPGSYVEASIDVPVGAGVWSAFWLVGGDIRQVGWPRSGELNVMEVVGEDTTWVHSAAHMSMAADPRTEAEFGWGDAGGSVDLGKNLRARPHTYGVYFDGQTVRFYVDRREHMRIWADDARASGWDWPFSKPQYLVLNIAIGAGNPASTAFPQTMTVGPVSIWRGGVPF
ncbi:glycoside hydrolase family 16 protein [Pseudofrankia saprophytica]|uniref:glycoside hydrolase family 16 protein n=1 Tax=Pseudofrankia saprophytica TaxID=298655 RepID=UPI001E30015F|nr:family 16 glycosylhydrolase [Pseudofrankia saprophytica]